MSCALQAGFHSPGFPTPALIHVVTGSKSSVNPNARKHAFTNGNPTPVEPTRPIQVRRLSAVSGDTLLRASFNRGLKMRFGPSPAIPVQPFGVSGGKRCTGFRHSERSVIGYLLTELP